MSRKKKPDFVVGEGGQRWNLDDFDLDSHGVEAPLKERLAVLAQEGRTPEGERGDSTTRPDVSSSARTPAH